MKIPSADIVRCLVGRDDRLVFRIADDGAKALEEIGRNSRIPD